VDDFARYLYLPRLVGPDVLLQAIRDGVALLTWKTDTFAFAERHDDAAGRYRGLRAGQSVTVTSDGHGLLVRPDVAARQMDAEVSPTPPDAGPGSKVDSGGPGPEPDGHGQSPDHPVTSFRRFHGSVRVDSTRVGRDAARIAEEVIAHLVAQAGAEVTVTLEIEARLPNGAADQLIRTVTENCRTLKFESQGFERD